MGSAGFIDSAELLLRPASDFFAPRLAAGVKPALTGAHGPNTGVAGRMDFASIGNQPVPRGNNVSPILVCGPNASACPGIRSADSADGTSGRRWDADKSGRRIATALAAGSRAATGE